MNRLYIVLCFLYFLFGCGNGDTKIKQYSIEQFYENQAVYGGSFSPNEEKLLITSNKSSIFNVWELSTDGSHKEKQLTFSKKNSCDALTYFPNDDRILYSSDKEGDEITHIWMRKNNGSVQNLTPWAGAKSIYAGWQRDSANFYFFCNKRDKRYFDLYLMNTSTYQAQLLYKVNNTYDLKELSNNHKYVVLEKHLTTSHNKLLVKNISDHSLFEISKEQASYSAQFIDKNSENLYYLTNEGSEFTYLVRLNLKSKVKQIVWKEKWDIWYADESYNGKYLVIGVNEDARTVIRVINQQSGEEINLPDFGNLNIKAVEISRSEKRMRLSVGSSKSPTNIYIYEFEHNKLTQLNNTLNPEISPNDLVDGEVVRFKSFDNLTIPAILYKPISATPKNKAPALLWVHGGPGGQSRIHYLAIIQYLVNRGYCVLAVNNRGSSGYGKTFFELDNQRHGEDDLKDYVYAKQYLGQTNWVDTTRVGIIGGSYGGYMVMAALTFQPETFDAGVNIFGVTNWLRTLKSIPPYWEWYREALYAEMGDPTSADSLRLKRISPLFHAKNVTKPLMVLQGANDPRVLPIESDEIVHAVRSNDVPVEYLLFSDEGHGFLKRENEINAYRQIRIFLDHHLKGEKP